MKVIMLAAGYGTRLRPLTDFIPKPMLPIAGKPALEHVIHALNEQGYNDLVIAVSHLAEQITNYFGDGSKFGVNIKYSYSKRPSGTAGEVWKAREHIDGTFICYYADIITNLDLSHLVAFHKKSGGIATVALVKGIPLEVGIVELNGDNTITNFQEKPALKQLVNAAIYVMEAEILDYIEKYKRKRTVDFGYHVFPALIKDKRKIYGCVCDGAYWYDLGTIRRYQQINERFTTQH